MLESIAYRGNPYFTNGTSVVVGVLFSLGLTHSLDNNLLRHGEYQYKTANKYSWEQELSNKYDFEIAFPVYSLMPHELIDQPNYLYSEMIALSKRLGLPTEFPI